MDKARNCIKEIIAFILTIGLVYILKDGGTTKYIVIMAVSGVFFLYGLKYFEKEFLILGIPAIIYIGTGFIISIVLGNISYQSIKEIAFAIVPLIAAISFFMMAQKTGVDFIRGQYWAMVLLTLSWLRYYYVEDVLETQYAFIFGVFLLYFCVIKREVKSILFTTVMLYLMNKRIAMLSAVLILVLYSFLLCIIEKKPEWKKKSPQYIGVVATIVCCAYILFLCAADLEGQFIQDLTSGRSSAWAAVKDSYQLKILWFGRGLGDMVNLLTELQFPSFTTNIHNDFLKVFAEIGTLGYGIWVGSHFIVCHWISKIKKLDFRRSIFLYLTMGYTLLIYMTDNIMVYVNYWFPAYLLMLMVAFSEEQDSIEEHVQKKEYQLLATVIVVFTLCIFTKMAKEYVEYKNPSNFIVPDDAVEIYSPDGGTTRATVWLRDGQPYYRVRYGGVDLVEASVLGIETKEDVLRKNVTFHDIICGEIVDENYEIMDKDNPIKASYQPVFIKMQEDEFDVGLELRLYDYGVAFRYVLPKGVKNYDELTQIRIWEGGTLNIYDEKTDMKLTNLSTCDLEKTIYSLPFSVRYINGSEIEVSEWQEDGELYSYVTKATRKKHTVDIEFYSKENQGANTPWRVFEIKR